MEDHATLITPYHIIFALDTGEHGEMEEYLRFFDTKDQLFEFVTRLYAFNDDYEVEVTEIIADGVRCAYVGWQPDMKFTYIDIDTREVVYEGYFPEFEH